MKKTLSVFLAVCMIFAFVPFFALADNTVVHLTQDNMPDNYALLSYTDYVIDSGVTVTIPATATLNIGNSSTLTVAEGGKLVLLGTCNVAQLGKLIVDGDISNADRIGNGGYPDVAVAKVTFPSLESAGLNGIIEVSYGVSYSGSAYDDLQGSSVQYEPVSPDGESVYLPLNQYVYIIAHIIEPTAGRDKFDDALMKVRLKDVEIPYSQNNHHTLLTTGGNISYSTWTNDNDFLNTYKIDLPNKEGVTVYGREGEMSTTDSTVYIKYGKPFSFRVDLDEAYDKSPIEVYIVSGYGWTNMDTSTILADLEPAKPDSDGYYTIPSVESDYTVFVMGVVANETIEKVGGIFEQVKSIFEMIKKFFNQFLALFGMSL